MKTIRLIAAMAVVAVLFNACVGGVGPAGADGTNGTNGANGVANISVYLYTVGSGSWVNTGSNAYIISLSADSITNPTDDGIEVFTSPDLTNFFPVPISNFLTPGDQLAYAYTNSSLKLIYDYPSAPTSTLYFKLVVIPPAVYKRHPNTNFTDYAQLMGVLNAQGTTSK